MNAVHGNLLRMIQGVAWVKERDPREAFGNGPRFLG
jgi:hypothetical protein